MKQFLWVVFGLFAAVIGGLAWRSHRVYVCAVNHGARMIAVCRRCRGSYSFEHPSQSRVAKMMHDEFDCPPKEEAA